MGYLQGSGEMNKQRFFSFTILLVATLAGGVYVYRHLEEFSALRIQHPGLIVVLLSLISCIFVVNGYVNALWYRQFGLRLRFFEWFGLSAVSTFGNFVVPLRGGAVSNAIYLKRAHGFAYSSFIGILAAVSILAFWVNSLLGLISLLLIYLLHGFFSQIVTLVFAASFLSLSALMWLSPGVEDASHSWFIRFSEAINGWRKIRAHSIEIFQTVALLVLNIILITFTTVVEFRILGLEVDISKALFLAIFPAFSSIISLTPANLGVREAFAVLSGIVAHVSIPEVLAVSLLDRFATFSQSFILGAIYYPGLVRRMSRHH